MTCPQWVVARTLQELRKRLVFDRIPRRSRDGWVRYRGVWQPPDLFDARAASEPRAGTVVTVKKPGSFAQVPS